MPNLNTDWTNAPECIITGCDFFSPIEGRYVHGDLHQVGDVYIFNAVLQDYNAAWREGIPSPGDMVVTSSYGVYWERRGVIFFTKASADFNDRATEYLKPKRRLLR